jgi:hypothetical protein
MSRRRVLAALSATLSILLCVAVYLMTAASALLLTVRARPELLLPVAKAMLLPLGIGLDTHDLRIDHSPPGFLASGLELTSPDGRVSIDRFGATMLADGRVGLRELLDRPVVANARGVVVDVQGEQPLKAAVEEVEARVENLRFGSGGRLLSFLTVKGPTVDLVLSEGGGEGDFRAEDLPSRIFDLLPADAVSIEGGAFRIASGRLLVSGAGFALESTSTEEFWSALVSGSLEAQDQGTCGGTLEADLRGTRTSLAGGLRLREGQASLQGNGEQKWSADAPFEAGARFDLNRDGLVIDEAEFTSPALSFEHPGIGLRLKTPVSMEARRKDGEVPSEMTVALTAGKLLELAGVVRDPFGELSADLTGRVPDVAAAARHLKPLLPEQAAGAVFDGELPLRLVVAGESVDLVLMPKALRVNLPEHSARGVLNGMVTVEGLTAEPVLGGKVRISSLEFRHPQAAVAVRGSVEFELGGKASAPEIPSFRLDVPAGALTYEGKPLPVGPVFATGRAELGREVRIRDGRLGAGELGTATLDLTLSGKGISGRVAAKGLSVAWIAAALPIPETRAMAAEWGLDGRISADGRFSFVGGVSDLRLTGALAGLTMASPDGRVLTQDGGGRFAIEARERGPVRIEIGLDRGEALVDTVYLDMKKSPVRLTGSGVLSGSGVRSVTAQGGIAPYFRFDLSGGMLDRRGDGWSYAGSLDLKEMDLASVYPTFLRDPLSAARPGLKRLEVSGRGKAEFSFSGTGAAVDIAGRARLTGASLSEGGDEPIIESLDLDLPLSYRFGNKEAESQRPEQPGAMGLLSIGAVRTAAGTFKDLRLPIALVPNRLSIQGNLFFPLYGGGVRVAGLVVDEPLSAAFRAETQVVVDRIDLSLIEGGPRLEGSIEGDLGLVSLDSQGLSATGGLAGSLYRGHLLIRNIQVGDPLGLSRTLGADVTVRRMDLARFSESFGFGLVTGRMDLDLDDLRIAYGQPVGFTLRAESVKEKGVPRKVSLAAVNAISVVGTGMSLTSTAITMFKPFVQEFAYDRIGILCSLTNDVFQVNGLIKEAGVEYLVKKPPLFGINVINKNPENRISFKDMLERINRVLPDEGDV